MKKSIFFIVACVLLATSHYADATCYQINYNAKYGMRDSSSSNNVSVLQAFLREYNFLVPGPSGYFGTGTFAAVKRFQASNGVSPVSGFVGVLTRAKMQQLSCSGNYSGNTNPISTIPSTPVTVIDGYGNNNGNSNSGSNGSTIFYGQNSLSTHTLYDGSNVIYRYKITAPDNAYVTIPSETLSFVQSGVRTSSLKLQMSNTDYFSYGSTDSNLIYDSSLDSSSYMSRDVTFNFYPSITIPAGQTRYFQVVQQINARTSGAYVNITHPRLGTERLSTDGASAAASIYITQPNTTDTLTKGSTYTIKWNTTQLDSSRTLNISLINQDGTSYSIGSVAASNSNYGEYAWTIPSTIPVKSGYQIKIESGGISDVSDSTFTIQEGTPAITVTSPTSSDVWNLDSSITRTVTWNASGFDSGRTAQVYLIASNGDSCTIGSATLSTGSFSIVPKSNSCISSTKVITPGQYRIAVGALNPSNVVIYGYSSGTFTVTSNSVDPTLMAVTSPNGGESLTATQATTITWTTPTYIASTDKVNVDLLVYTSSGSSAYRSVPLATNINNTKSLAWTIPSTLAGSSYIASDRYKIAVTAVKNSSYTDASNDFFTINPLNRIITITAPTQTSIARDTDFTVSWNKTGFLSTDKLNIAITPVGSAVNTVIKSGVLVNDGSATAHIPIGTALNSYRITLVPASFTFGSGSVAATNLFALTNKTGYSIVSATVASALAKGDYVTTTWTASNLTSPNITIRLLTGDGTVVAGSAVTVAVSSGQKDILIPATLTSGSYKFSYEGVSDGAAVTVYSNTFTVSDPTYAFALTGSQSSVVKNSNMLVEWTGTHTRPADTVAVMIRDSVGNVVTQNTTMGANAVSIKIPSTFVSGAATVYATTTGVGYTRPVLTATKNITIVDQVFPTITVLTPAANSTSTFSVNASWQNNNFSSAAASITSLRVSLVQLKGVINNSVIIESGLSPSTTNLLIPISSSGNIGTMYSITDGTYNYQIKVEALAGTTVMATGITNGTFKIHK